MTKFVLHGGFNVEKASVHTHNCIKRVKNYIPLFKRDDTTFQIEVDEKGESKRDEEFTEFIKEFKEWVNTQEETLVKKFS